MKSDIVWGYYILFKVHFLEAVPAVILQIVAPMEIFVVIHLQPRLLTGIAQAHTIPAPLFLPMIFTARMFLINGKTT